MISLELWRSDGITQELLGNDGQREQWRASIPLEAQGFIRLRAELVD